MTGSTRNQQWGKMSDGCRIWGFEPETVEDCPEIGSARCPCTCGLFAEYDEYEPTEDELREIDPHGFDSLWK